MEHKHIFHWLYYFKEIRRTIMFLINFIIKKIFLERWHENCIYFPVWFNFFNHYNVKILELKCTVFAVLFLFFAKKTSIQTIKSIKSFVIYFNLNILILFVNLFIKLVFLFDSIYINRFLNIFFGKFYYYFFHIMYRTAKIFFHQIFDFLVFTKPFWTLQEVKYFCN